MTEVFVLEHSRYHNVWPYRAFPSEEAASAFLRENPDMADYRVIRVPIF